MIPTCPDCGAVMNANNHLQHAMTCPIGIGIDEMCDGDRKFFDRHPHLTQRRRPPNWAEVADLKLMGALPPIPGELCGEVVVTLLGPGLRARSFDEMYFVLTTKETT